MMCFDEWSSSILSHCGRYNSTPVRRARNRVGDFRFRHRHGIGIVELDCEAEGIDRIDRLTADIRRDENEYLFLLVQTAGEVGVVHNGREELLTPGDSLLLDSTRTAEMHFSGRAMSMMSVHLPRGICLEGRAASPSAGRRVGRSHPLRASLMNLLANDHAEEASADYLFDFVALMFRADEQAHDAGRLRNRYNRFRYICDVAERHLSEADLTIERLAAMVNMSKRQLQRDFSDNGTTFTRFLGDRRMKLVASHLRRAAQLSQRPAISDLAYRVGFSDLSHFNRGFRKIYGTSPRGYYTEQTGQQITH